MSIYDEDEDFDCFDEDDEIYHEDDMSSESAFDGDIVGLHNEAHILWKIYDYFSQEKADFFYESPYFHFLGSTWNFSIYPNGHRENESVGFVGLYVHRRQMFQKCDMVFTMSIMNGDIPLCQRKHQLNGGSDGCGWDFFIERRILTINKLQVAPDSTLTIKFVGEPLKKKSLPKSVQPKQLSVSQPSASQTKIINGRRDPNVAVVHHVARKRRLVEVSPSVEPQIQLKGVDGLSRDISNLLQGGQATDVNIRVKTQMFPAHKLILSARSTVFAAKFQRDRMTGSVTIEDCEPSVFHKFLAFVYSGNIDLGSEDVIDVFCLADKYDVGDLRQICADFMKDNLCLSVACNALVIADKLNLQELKKSATELILRNINTVMSAPNWINFVKKNAALCTEILRQAFAKG